MDNRSLVVAIVSVVLSLVVALVSVAIWLGSLKQKVDTLLEESTSGAVAAAQESIKNAATEAAEGLDEVLAPGAILPVYSMPTNLPPGWVICGSEDGTPNLRDRFLLGTTDVAEAGNSVGRPTHLHEMGEKTGGETSGRWAPEREDNPNYTDNIPSGHGVSGDRNWYHEHLLRGQTDAAESPPPSVKVIFLCRVGGDG